jgi:predicted DNA-binding protein
MDISNDTGAIDNTKFLDYIAKNFVDDLSQMIALRDELVARQGALSAVAQINADREEAKALLESAKADFAERDKHHKEKAADLKAKKAAFDAASADLEKRIEDFEAETSAKEKSLALREEAIAAKIADTEDYALALEAKNESIKQDRAALDARIVAFQEKVAAISI